MPAAWNHSAISRLSAAAPEMKNRTRPPKRSRILLNTSLSKTPCCSLSGSGTDLPSRLSWSTLRPTSKAFLKIFSLAPPSAACMVMIRPCAFSKMRGAAPMNVGFTTAEVVDDLVDPAVDGGRRSRRRAGSDSSTLPNECAIGSHRNCEVVLVEDVLRLRSRRPRRPRTGAAAGRPWGGRWCRRCRSAWRAGRARSAATVSSTASGCSAR